MNRHRFSARDIYDIHWMGIDTGKTLSQIATVYGVGPGSILFVKKNIKRCWENNVQSTKNYKVAIKLIKEEENRRITVNEAAKTVRDDIEIDDTIKEVVERKPATNSGFHINLSSVKEEKPEHLRKLEYAYETFQKALTDFADAEFKIKNADFLKEYNELKDLMENARNESLIESLQKRFHLTV